MSTFYKWYIVGSDPIKALQYVYNKTRKMYWHLDKCPIIFYEIITSDFNIEISIILHEIRMSFN